MCSLMMISGMLSKHVGAVKSVLKKWFKINDIQLVHLLVVWYLVNLQDARCNNKDNWGFYVYFTAHCDVIMQHKPAKCILFHINSLIHFFSIFDVFYMFRTSRVHPQEDSCKRNFVWYVYMHWIKLSTWSCLEIRTQDEVTVWRLIIVPLKGWNSSNIWEQR